MGMLGVGSGGARVVMGVGGHKEGGGATSGIHVPPVRVWSGVVGEKVPREGGAICRHVPPVKVWSAEVEGEGGPREGGVIHRHVPPVKANSRHRVTLPQVPVQLVL